MKYCDGTIVKEWDQVEYANADRDDIYYEVYEVTFHIDGVKLNNGHGFIEYESLEEFKLLNRNEHRYLNGMISSATRMLNQSTQSEGWDDRLSEVIKDMQSLHNGVR